MNPLTNDDKLFCKTFLDTFNFKHSCEVSSTNKVVMAARIADETDMLNVYIRNAVDTARLANIFFTQDLVKNELVKILIAGDDKHKLQSSKMLLSLDDNPDKSKDFSDLVNLLKQQ